MLTLGIDLAAEPRDTGGCLVEWRGGRAAVSWVRLGLSDEDILREAAGADAVGIDAPFGWPTLFVEAVAAHHASRPWPVRSWDGPSRRRLRLRTTDRRVREMTGLTPLSVSSDTIAIPATRCASLLDRMGVTDRSGDGRVFEVYPAASLRRWGLPHRGYKGKENARALRSLLSALRRKAPWLEIPAGPAELCARDDDAFDALVASLVARAAAKRLTSRPGPGEADGARVEGWIALPEPDSLDRLP